MTLTRIKSLPLAQPVIANPREWASNLLIGALLLVGLSDPGIGSPWVLVYWVTLGLVVLVSPRTWAPKLVVVGLGVIVYSAGLAIATAHLVIPTVILFMFTLPMVLLFWVDYYRTVWVALIAAALINAALIFAQATIWQDPDVFRLAGVGRSSNPTAGLLLLGVIVSLWGGGRWTWWSLPLLLALPFTGARWVALVGVVVLGAFLATRRSRWLLIGGMGAVIVVVATWGTVAHNYRLNRGPAALWGDFAARTPLDPMPSLIPHGFRENTNTLWRDVRLDFDPEHPIWQDGRFEGLKYDTGIGLAYGDLHSLPVRLAVESGILAAVAWLGLSLWAVWRRPRLDRSWWLMAAILGLSVMYYWTWIGPLGAVWWILLSVRLKGYARGQGV